MNKYRKLFHRVEYPLERGYRMEPYDLPDWIHLEIVTDNLSKRLYVCSRIHVNKRVQCGPSYSLEWSDCDILKDLSATIWSRWIKA